jgi:hypothetical protein
MEVLALTIDCHEGHPPADNIFVHSGCAQPARGPAEESTFRRAFALVSADRLDQVRGTWLWTRAIRAGGRLVIAAGGKTVRGAKNKEGRAPHLVAALAHSIGTILGQADAGAKLNEIPAVRDLLTVKGNMPTLYRQLKKLPWAAIPAASSRPPGPPHHQGRPGAVLDRVRRRCPGRAAMPHRHEKRQGKDRAAARPGCYIE